MGNENTEYKCSACKKIIKSHLMSCKQCIGTYFHPGYMAKYRISDANKENVTCKEPYDMFCVDDEEESREAISMEEPSDVLSMRRRLMDINESMKEKMKEMKESIKENNKRTKNMQEEMKEMKEIMNKIILKDEAKGMINKVQQDFIKEAKRELREARKPLEDRTENRVTKSYSDVTNGRKERTIVVRLKK